MVFLVASWVGRQYASRLHGCRSKALTGKQNGASPGSPRCGAKTRSGGACGRPSGWGTDHVGVGACKLHGGCMPNHKTAARKELARRGVETFGLPLNVEPIQALMDELHRTAGHVAWLGEQVRDLEEDGLYGPVGTEGQVGEGGAVSHPKQEAHIWVRLYQEERDRLTRVAKTCIDAGIAERQVRIAEQQGQLLAGVIRAVLTGLGIDPASAKARKVVRKELTAASGPEQAIAGQATEKVAA